jgi:hypothetical protein
MVLRLTVLTVVLLMAVLLTPPLAVACSCMRQEREQAFEEAVSVFEGRVTAIDAPADGPVVVTFDVVRTWKGAESETFTLRTQTNSAACGYAFQSGTSYIVYTYQGDGDGEWTGLCSRTSPADDPNAAADIDAMGAGVTPVSPVGEEEPPPEPAEAPPLEQRADGGCASCSVAGGEDSLTPIVCGALLLGFAFRRLTAH